MLPFGAGGRCLWFRRAAGAYMFFQAGAVSGGRFAGAALLAACAVVVKSVLLRYAALRRMAL